MRSSVVYHVKGQSVHVVKVSIHDQLIVAVARQSIRVNPSPLQVVCKGLVPRGLPITRNLLHSMQLYMQK